MSESEKDILKAYESVSAPLTQNGGLGYFTVADASLFKVGARVILSGTVAPPNTYIIVDLDLKNNIIWVIDISPNGSRTPDLSAYTTADSATASQDAQIINLDATNIIIGGQTTPLLVTATGGGSLTTVNQGSPNSIVNAWPIKITDGTDIALVTSAGALQVDGSATIQPISGSVSVNNFPATQPVSGTVSALQSGTWTVQPGNTPNTNPWLTTINQGGNSAAVTGANALKVDGSGVTQPISGTVGVTQSTTPWVVGSNNFVDTNNSSTTPLGSNGVFTGTATSVVGFTQVAIQVFADKNSAAGGLSIQFSSDGINWDYTDNETVTANIVFNIALGIKASFFRIVYTNTNSAQTIFRLNTIVRASTSNGIIQNIDSAPLGTDEALLTKSVISGKTTGGGGGYVDVKVNPSGTLTVDASGSTVNQGGIWNINNITGTVSLPTGASTAANQTTLGSQTTKINDGTNTAAVTVANALKVDGSGATQPISGSVSVSNFPATQPVSGTVTSNQGTAASPSGSWPVEITDGTNVLGTPAHPIRVDPTGTTTQPISGTVSAQPTLPTIPRLSSVPISLTTVSGDQILVAGIGGQTIRIFKLFLVFSTSTSATFKDGPSTPFDGSLAMLSSGSIVLDLDTEPWFVTSMGNDFILNLGSTTSVGGRVYYLQS